MSGQPAENPTTGADKAPPYIGHVEPGPPTDPLHPNVHALLRRDPQAAAIGSQLMDDREPSTLTVTPYPMFNNLVPGTDDNMDLRQFRFPDFWTTKEWVQIWGKGYFPMEYCSTLRIRLWYPLHSNNQVVRTSHR